jgi:hypothetical protein
MPRDYKRALAERAQRDEPLEASGASAGG